jgi:proline racemase
MSFTLARVIQTVDSHTEGNPTRVIVGGVAPPPGTSVPEKRDWLRDNNDALRRLLNFEPRGSGMMCSVLLMPPLDDRADFAVIIMEQDAYVPMCGHCIIGAATTVVATGMVEVVEPVTTVRFEAPAGLVTCAVAVRGGQPESVSFTNVESFLLLREAEIETATLGRLAVDVAYGGDFYAVADADALGLELDVANEAALIAAAREIRPAVEAQLEVRHPERADIDHCYMVQFISRKTKSGGDLRNTVVAPPGALDRSPCGTGTSAQVARLTTLGELAPGERLRLEGPLGTFFDGEAVATETRGGLLYVTPRVTGRAYITGFHQFVLDPDDPFPAGYRVGSQA